MKKRTKIGVTMLVAMTLALAISAPIFVQASAGPPGGSVWQVNRNSVLVFETSNIANARSGSIGIPARITFPNGNPAQVTNGRVRGNITGETVHTHLNGNGWVTTWAVINAMTQVSGSAW